LLKVAPAGAESLGMRVPGHCHLVPTVPTEAQPALPAADGAFEGRLPLCTDVPLEGREGVVKARLSSLMAALGEVPGQFEPPPPPVGQGLARLIDDICPAGTVVVHARSVPGCSLDLEHIVVASRGLVVVSPEWAVLAGEGAGGDDLRGRTRAGASSSRGPDRRRSRQVRETLRRSNALRAWLAGTSWAGTPVLAAVCSPPLMGPASAPPVLLDGLWFGPIERLPSWLGSGDKLDVPARAALGYFLAADLPA